MPKDNTKEPEEEMVVNMVATTARSVSSRTVAQAASGTLTAMWSKKAKVSAKAEPSKIDDAVASESSSNANIAGPSKASPNKGVKRDSAKQTHAIMEAILESLEEDTMGDSWKEVLAPEFKKPYFLQLKKFLLTEHIAHTVYPTTNNIYSWSRLTPLDQVKVVIIGQDPYHDVNQAHGLSFSVLAPTKPPPSLKNIYKQLETDIPGFKAPKTGDLSAVAQQGVLWLNTSLTVQAHKAASHSRKGWETFTAQVLRAVLQRKGNDQPGVVFMAWGLPAQKALTSLGIDEKKHLLLKSAHPSPLSAHRGFLGNGHFKTANEWLTEKYGKEAQIDWTVISAK